MDLNGADVSCVLSIILHSLKLCLKITQAACHPLTSGPVYSCYSSPCRWRKWGSPFHSQVCSWSVGWQCLLTGPCWSLIWSAICSVIYKVGECSPAAGTDQPQDCLCRAQDNLRHRHLSSSAFYFVHSGWNSCGIRKYTGAKALVDVQLEFLLWDALLDSPWRRRCPRAGPSARSPRWGGSSGRSPRAAAGAGALHGSSSRC